MCPDHPSGHIFAERRRNCYYALIEIPLLVTTIVAEEFCHQHWRRLWENPFFSVNPITSNCKDDFTLKESFFRQRWRRILRVAKHHGKTTARKRTVDANFAPRNKETQGRKQCLEDPRLFPTSALSAEEGSLSQPGSSIPPRGEPNPQGA